MFFSRFLLRQFISNRRERVRRLHTPKAIRRAHRIAQPEALEIRDLLAAVALDASFGSDGRVTTDIGLETPGSYDEAYDVVSLQPDGKLIAAGASNGPAVVVRYNADGTLDTSFGDDPDGDGVRSGKRLVDIGDEESNVLEAQGVAFDSLGRIIVAVQFHHNNSGTEFAVVRLTSDGILDPTFGPGGEEGTGEEIDFGSDREHIQDVAIDSQDRIIVVGYYEDEDFGNVFAVARLNSRGELDFGFGEAGTAIVDFGGNGSEAHSVAIDSQGRIVIAGLHTDETGYDFAVARLTTDGALDPDFDTDGKATIDFDSSHSDSFGVAVDSHGRIVVAGYSHQGATGFDFAVARLTSAGVVDPGFDGDGKATVDLGSSRDFGNGVAVDAEDRVVVAGQSYDETTGGNFAIVRFTVAGAADSEFADEGKIRTDFGGGDDAGRSVTIDQQGRIVVAGTSNQSATGPDFALARYAAVEAASPADLENVIENLIASGQTQLELSATQANTADFLQAIAALPPNMGEPFEITLVIEGGTLEGQIVNVPEGYTLIVDGADGQTIFTGASPALTVLAGDVVFRNNITFTNTTDAPTILVQGGSLTLRDVLVEETNLHDRAAIEITGGTVDLGTGSDSGGNTFHVRGAGEAIRNSTATDIPALGNTFQIDGMELVDAFAVEDEIYHALDEDGLGLVSFVAENLDPRITAISTDATFASPGAERQTVTVSGGFRDVGSIQNHSISIDWGDGAVEPLSDTEARSAGTFSGSHVYADGGLYTVTVTVTDDHTDDRGTGVLSTTAVIAGVGLDLETGTLEIVGTSGDDHVTVHRIGAGAIRVHADFLPSVRFKDFPAADVDHIVALLGDGDDRMKVAGNMNVPVLIDEGDGNDRLKGGRVHQEAISAVMAEWTSERDYRTRIENLSGVGNGSRRLKGMFSLWYETRTNERPATVFADDEMDFLTSSK